MRVEILPSTGMTASPEQMPARRYRIERYLTEGGMGAIYVGKKLGPGGFEKEVVLKQLLPEYTARPEFRDLFFREAKISATLDHANIVHIFDLVESDESLFIVMEYVRGVDLRTIIRRAKLRRRELSPAAALHITLEVLAGLAYAHTRRDPNGASMAIIHRDVSPSNILCSVAGRGEAVRLRHRQGRRRTRRSSTGCAARSATCRPSRRATSRSITAPISTRSRSASTRR